MLNKVFKITDFHIPSYIRVEYPELSGIMISIDTELFPSRIITVPGTSIYAYYSEHGSLAYIYDIQAEKLIYETPD